MLLVNEAMCVKGNPLTFRRRRVLDVLSLLLAPETRPSRTFIHSSPPSRSSHLRDVSRRVPHRGAQIDVSAVAEGRRSSLLRQVHRWSAGRNPGSLHGSLRTLRERRSRLLVGEIEGVER